MGERTTNMNRNLNAMLEEEASWLVKQEATELEFYKDIKKLINNEEAYLRRDKDATGSPDCSGVRTGISKRQRRGPLPPPEDDAVVDFLDSGPIARPAAPAFV